MAVRAVVFDIGGVLEWTPDLDVRDRWGRALELPAGIIGDRLVDVWAAGQVGGVSEDDVHTALRDRLDLTDEQVAALLADLWREYLGTANHGMIDYARSLRGRVPTGIVSNSFVGARSREQAAYGFSELTDVVVYSHEAGLQKPDPAIYRLVCERLHVAPEQTALLDDRQMAVDGARAVGMHPVLFTGDNAAAIEAIEQLLATVQGDHDAASRGWFLERAAPGSERESGCPPAAGSRNHGSGRRPAGRQVSCAAAATSAMWSARARGWSRYIMWLLPTTTW